MIYMANTTVKNVYTNKTLSQSVLNIGCWIHKPVKYLDTSPLLDEAICFGIQNLLWLFHFSSNSGPTPLIN